MRVGLSTVTLEVHERPGVAAADPAKPALVFLHHFGGSGRTWGPVLDELAADGYRCLAPDLRGFGSSDAPGGEDWAHYAVDAMADDVHELLGRLEVGPFILVGHSMGGKVSLALVSRGLTELRGLVLLAPSPPTPEPMPDEERARLLASHGNADAARKTAAKITAAPLPEPLRQLAEADLLRVSPAAWRAWLEHGSREDISARVRPLSSSPSVPVFLAAGERDENITADLLRREIVDRLGGGAELNVIPGANHLLPLETPRVVVDLVRRAAAAGYR